MIRPPPRSPLFPTPTLSRPLRPDPGAADDPLKAPPLGFVPEPVQRPAVFPHDELGGEVDALADGRQLLHDAERDGDLVADAARGLDHDAVGQFRGEASRDLGDHARRMCVSATATPSAASAGVGACFSLRSRATTAPTWPLGAPPAPATVSFPVAAAACALHGAPAS